MVKTVQTNASVRMKPYVILELDHAIVLLDGWEKRVMKVSKQLHTMQNFHQSFGILP